MTFDRSEANPPSVYPFSEMILQALLKKHLRDPANLHYLFAHETDMQINLLNMEVLGELALPEGQVDILVKDATPIGASNKIAIEAKVGAASRKDVDQVANYVATLGPECRAGVLVSRAASERVLSYAKSKQVLLRFYDFDPNPRHSHVTFKELSSLLALSKP